MAKYTEVIQKLYVAYFNRPADVAGLKYWEATVEAKGGDTSEISAAFSVSQEYNATYFAMNSRQVVNQIYLNLFGRNAEPAGLDYWAKNLDAGKLTMVNVVTEVSRGAQGTDLISFNAKVSAADSFTSGLSTYSMANKYAGNNALIAARNFLTNVTDITSLNSAKANISAALESLALSNITINSELNLTEGKDRLFGGSADDRFIGSISEMQKNLNDGDVIYGGLGLDTIHLSSESEQTYVLPNKVTVNSVENVKFISKSGIVADTSSWLGLQEAIVSARGSVDLTLGKANLDLSVSSASAQPVVVNGGNNITMFVNNDTTRGKLSIGTSNAPTGDVKVSLVGSFADLGGLVDVVAGKTVAIYQKGGAIPLQVTATKLTTDVQISLEHVHSGISYFPSPRTISSLPVTINALDSGNNSANHLLNNVMLSGDAAFVVNNSNVVQSLKVSSNNGSITTISGDMAEDKKLDLSVDNFYGFVTDSGGYSEINMHAVGQVLITSMSAPSIKKMSIDGPGLFIVNSADMPMLETLVATTSITFNNQSVALKNLKLMDLSITSGSNVANIDPSVTVYLGGKGADFVSTVSKNYVNAGKLVDLGDGENYLFAKSGNVNVRAGNGADTAYMTEGENKVDLGDGMNLFWGGDAHNTYIGGKDKDQVNIGSGLNTITFGGGASDLILTKANVSVQSYSTVTDPQSGLRIVLPEHGVEEFAPAMLTLAGEHLRLQDYADAVIVQGGDASTHAKSGWFQFAGDTYYVQSQHNGVHKPSFQGSVDFMLKLVGLVDLSTASLNSEGNIFSLG